jgi:hypothetical protein
MVIVHTKVLPEISAWDREPNKEWMELSSHNAKRITGAVSKKC